ncbi:MAG: S8 family serine peptidase [bacterium]
MSSPRARVLSIGILALLLAFTVSTSSADPITRPHHPDEIIIKFKDTAPQSQKDAILADIGAVQLKHFKRIKSDHKKLNGITADEAIGRYKNHPAIEYIEPNYILSVNDFPDDPRFPELWGMFNEGQTGGTPGADISAPSAWDVFTGSHDVVIGVIDTGVDYNHPDLAANIYANPGEIPGNGIDDDGNGFVDDVRGWDFINNDNDPMDDNGHGTHCSGTIGGVGDNGIGVAGVNWHVKIMPLKFLSAGGSGSTDDAISCIEYATMMGVNLTSNSWGGGGFSEAMRQAIADAGAANVLFVAAAGNSSSNNDTSPHYPSSYTEDNVVAVAATDHNDELAGFSSYGATSVDLAAPGVNILSTLPGNSYGQLSGTSMATPHGAGALGLVFGRFPAIDALDAKNLILNFADPVPDLDGMVLTGGRLNAFMPIADPDSIPPGMITDLAVGTAGSNWLDVSWTAPGDDDYTGKASRYDLRYATAFIDETNWDDAVRVTGEPGPSPAGAFEQMRVDGLAFNTTYYLGIIALDEFGNASPISNVPMGTTLGAPDIAAAPASFSDALLTGGTSTQSLTLSNVGMGTLDFVIPTPTLLGGPVLVHEAVDLPKGALDTRTGDPVTEGSGGPDMYGYRWVDSNDPFGPVFAWQDISGMGSVAIASGDDVNAGPFAIGFDFPFYGGEYAEFRVCSNGWLSFTSTATSYSNQPLPTSGAPEHLIAPFWDDLNTTPGAVYYYGDGTRLVVQWEGVSHYGSGGPYSFQAILYADGTIEYMYNAMGDPTDSATVGIQNGDRTDGLTVAFNTGYVADGLAVSIKAVPQWVTVAPASGTVWAPGSTALDVTFDASGLVGGVYDGMIRILSNDPDEPETQIPVQLSVTGAPDILVTPLAYDFGDLFLGATPSTTVMVRNTGTDLLTVSGITIDDPAFTADQASFVLAPGASQPVNVTFAPTVAQPYSATMTVTSDAPNDPVVLVSLSGQGLVPPDFSVTPTSLTSDLLTGQTENQTLMFTNSGGADFEFDLSVAFNATVTVHNDVVEVGKDEVDMNAGEPVTEGSGGPDIFGYRWIDSDEPGGPTYDWIDISTTGTPVFSGANDDRNVGPFPIGFDFPFYDNTFSDFRVCSNGWLSFTSTSTDLSNAPLPGTGAPENLLAMFHDDLRPDTATGGNVFYEYDGVRLIVQFNNVLRYSSGGPYTFQALLYPDGTIVYQYADMQGTRLDEATIGIQNAARDDGLTVVYNADYVHDGLAIRFQAFPEWLTVNPAAGVIPPGGSLPVTARFNSNGLFGGTYTADIVVDSNDPALPNLAIPATMNVTGAPDILVAPLSIDYGNVFVGTPTLQNLVISNVGTDDLVLTGWTLNNPDFGTDLTVPDILGPTQSLIVTMRFTPSVVGLREAVFTLASNDPDQPSVTVDLSGYGLLPPDAAVSPTSLVSNLFTGEMETQSVTLSNTGASDLDWTASTLLGAAEVAVFADDADLGKEELDPRPGILGSGGPDLYGYRWKDSDEVGGPAFVWTDISTTGTAVFSGTADDVNTGPFAIGFTFPFYGTPFTEFRISSNGFLSFTSTSSDLSNAPLPGTGAPENLLAIFHDDLRIDTSTGANVFYEYDGSKLIVQWHQVPKYFANGQLTFQAHLYPNGTIFYYYLSMTDAALNSATIGIQNATRDDGLTVVYNDTYVHDNMAIRIAPVSDWLTVSPASGAVPPGGSQTIDVVFNAAELFGGTYEGAVRLETNDPNAGVIDVPATLNVTGVPVLAVDPSALDFGDVYIGYPDLLQLTVSNAGTDLLTVTGMTSTLGDYTADPAVFDLDPFESQVVTVTFSPSAAGPRNDMLEIASNDSSSPAMVSLSGVGVEPPVVTWSPDPIVGAAMPGGTKVKTLTVCNEGGSDLVWTLNASESLASDMVVYPELVLGKEEEDPRPGILGSGGPDTFGHTWIDSDDPGGPAFMWTDISATGTAVFGQYEDDDNYGPQPIGFDFPFYGNSFSEFYVCSNGWLSFTNSTLRTYSNQPLPNAGSSVPENLIAPFWDDMVVDPVTRGLEVHYLFDGEKLIVQYDVRRIAAFNPPYYSFQVLLYPGGDIKFQYDTLGAVTNSATIGIQNGTRDDGLMMAYNTDYLHEGLAILITSAPGWLSAAPESGVIPAGECAEITVTMDASELEEGDYNGTLTLTSNDPATPTANIDVIFHVATVMAADVDVDPNTLNLDSNGKWMTGFVELPAGYATGDVVIETVMFNGVVPVDGDRYALFEDFNDNGILDMMFKFDRSLIEEILPEGEQVAVTITGEIRDTAYFVATDTIRVIRPRMTSPNGGEIAMAGTTINLQWENPVNWSVDHSDVYYSADGGESWTLIAAGVAGTSAMWQTPATVSDQMLVRVFAFDNRGVLGFDTTDETFTLTDQASGVDLVVPTVYALGQNHPNPFNPRTTIMFDLPDAGMTRLAVYDLRGRLVRTLVSRAMTAGRHQVIWNGDDDHGQTVASGVYYYRITAGTYDAVKSMTLLK